MRSILNRFADHATTPFCHEFVPDATEDWNVIQSYILMHAQAKEIIGSGITSITIRTVGVLKDPNRRNNLRVDFFVYRSDGTGVRLHPGKSARLDAQIIYL